MILTKFGTRDVHWHLLHF